MAITVTAAQGAGAYIGGVDLTSIDAADTALLREALGQHGVLFFRQQSLSPEAHIALAQKFGAININRFFNAIEGYPQIAQVLKEANQKRNIGEEWHTDHSYDQIPALGSILVARELPATGGDTFFVSMFAAYEGLDEKMKERIKDLAAVHSSRHAFGMEAQQETNEDGALPRFKNANAATQDAIHPIVIRHPISGRRGIYVNPDFTVRINGLSEGESEELLDALYCHCKKEAFRHRFSWQEGSVAFWDNRATWHKAINDYHGQRRLMHRITIEGEALHA